MEDQHEAVRHGAMAGPARQADDVKQAGDSIRSNGRYAQGFVTLRKVSYFRLPQCLSASILKK